MVAPRIGKYDEDGNPLDIPAHSLPLAALGVFILWFGWFGFNTGSTTAGTTDIALIAINTFLSAGAAATTAMMLTWIRDDAPDAPMTMNGVQMIGIGTVFVWTFGASYVVFSILDSTVGLRVGEESEHIGLDEHEHEISAYPDFASNGNGEVAEKVSC